MRPLVLTILALTALVSPALAASPGYVDDRSSPESVITSFYNAISTQEYARAWSYYENGEGVPAFDAFVTGYQNTKSVAVTMGEPSGDGAAGSTYWHLPVSLDAVDTSGKHSYFAGCYTLRLANPQIQAEPPFEPLHITEGHLKKAKGAGKSYLPTSCDQ